MLKKDLLHIVKGAAMGAANVIPGVSGGTIALITGIFERLIHAIKSLISAKSISLFFRGKFKEFARHIDLRFLLTVGIGIIIAIISLARLLEFLFESYPVQVWSFFFGLILASIYFVNKTVSRWNLINMIFFALGTVIAVTIALLTPASENNNFLYLLLCGAVAACSMILPGVSGSFVLLLMGNYELVMIRAVNEADIITLIPVVIGAGAGLIGFSYILSWIFKKFRNQTIALLSGFMLGSLLIIWPWKEAIFKRTAAGEIIYSRSGKELIEKYQWNFPETFDTGVILAIAFILLGILVIWVTEVLAAKKSGTP